MLNILYLLYDLAEGEGTTVALLTT